MNRIKKNTDSLSRTLLFILLALVLISFASTEKKGSPLDRYSSITICTLDHYTTTAIIPSSVELPIRASFIDESHTILDYPAASDYLINLRILKKYNTAKEKLLSIRPYYNKIFRQLLYQKNEEGEISFLS